MKTLRQRLRDEFWQLLFVHLVPTLLFALRRPIDAPDSAGYIANAVYRTPGYPLFIDVHELLLGAHFKRGVVVSQHFLGVLAAIFVARALSRRFDLGRVGTWILFYLMALPQTVYAQWILSESIAYSLLLVAIREACEALVDVSLRRMIRVSAWVAVGVLIRPQFLFMVPTLVLAFVVVLVRGPRRPMLLAALGSLVIFIAANLGQDSYNYAYNRVFGPIPFTGIQLLILNLYVAERQDLTSIDDAEDRRFVETVLAKMERDHIRLADKPNGTSTADHSLRVYNYIGGHITTTFLEFAGKTPTPLPSPDDWVGQDCLTLRVTRQLLGRTWLRYGVNVVKVAYQSSLSFGLLALFLLVYAPIAYARTRDALWGFVSIAAMLWFSNKLLVCLLQGSDPRYHFYTDVTLGAALLVMLLRLARASVSRSRSCAG